MSLTIRSSSPKTPEALPRRSTLVQTLSQPSPRVRHQFKGSTRKRLRPPEWNVPVLQMQSPVSSLYAGEVSGPPIFTKVSLSTCDRTSLPLENPVSHRFLNGSNVLAWICSVFSPAFILVSCFVVNSNKRFFQPRCGDSLPFGF